MTVMRGRISVRTGQWIAAVILVAVSTVVTACGGPTTVAGPRPTTVPTSTATPTPHPTATATADARAGLTGDVRTDASASTALLVEQRLARLGYPTGTVDGVVSVRTRQALCAWRDTHGLSGGRSGLTTDLARSILNAPFTHTTGRADGLYISKTCQVLFQVVGGTYRRIVWVSTAMPGYSTPSGSGQVWRTWAGAHESSLYPDAWMYDALYFRRDYPGIALHGSARNSLVHSYPASHGCVRVWRPTIHAIFNETPIGTRVVVYGAY